MWDGSVSTGACCKADGLTSRLCSTGLAVHAILPGFVWLYEFLGLNAGPSTHTLSALPTEPSPEPNINFSTEYYIYYMIRDIIYT